MKYAGINNHHDGTLVFPQLSEQQIFELQDVFLTYGCNYLNVSSLAHGRTIISLFLDSINCYSRVACLSLSQSVIALPASVVNLYDELALHGALAFAHHQLDDFLLNKFYYDFLWIECDEELINSAWFYHFEKKLVEYKLHLTMPILFVPSGNLLVY